MPAMRLLTDAEIAEKVVELVAWARARYGIAGGMQAADACEAVGLGLQRASLGGGRDGLLRDEKRLILVEAGLTDPGRTEFTVYHEITHHLLEQDGWLIEYFTETLRDDERAFEAAIERCCHAGAAEFLLPREAVVAAIRRDGFSVELVASLAPETRASIATIATQLAMNAPVDCYVAVCFHGTSPRYPHAYGLYAEVSVRASGAFPIARGTMIPPDHLFHRAWDSGRRVEGFGYIPFSSGKSYPCKHGEAVRIGNQVVGILYCANPQRKGQLSLELPLL